MFPIRDHNPSGRTPYVTYALIAANVAIFVLYWFALPNERALGYFFYTWGLVPEQVIVGQGWVGFITSMFLHGGWMHLLGNMLFLWIFGDNLEDLMGHRRYALFYLAAGLAAGIAQTLTDPYSSVPMVGASGAIAGVMGGYLLMFPRAKVDVLFIFVIFFRIFPIPAWIVLGIWFAVQLFSGLNTPSDGGGVAFWAHVGGFVAGVVLAVPLFTARGGTAFWSRNHGAPPNPVASYPLARSRIPSVPRRPR